MPLSSIVIVCCQILLVQPAISSTPPMKYFSNWSTKKGLFSAVSGNNCNRGTQYTEIFIISKQNNCADKIWRKKLLIWGHYASSGMHTCKKIINEVSPVKRICVFEHSVITNFNCTCPAIQRGQGSGFLSEGSSWLTACMSEQRRFWRDCADVQARLNLRYSPERLITKFAWRSPSRINFKDVS